MKFYLVKKETAYEVMKSIVCSEKGIRDSVKATHVGPDRTRDSVSQNKVGPDRTRAVSYTYMKLPTI